MTAACIMSCVARLRGSTIVDEMLPFGSLFQLSASLEVAKVFPWCGQWPK